MWTVMKKQTVKKTPLPGVYELKKGGHLARAIIVDPTTGRSRELYKVFPTGAAHEALTWLEEEKTRIRSGVVQAKQREMPFGDFVVQLREDKIAGGDIKSAKNKDNWRYVLAHLVGGTGGVKGFGDVYLSKLSQEHIDVWRVGIGRLVARGEYSPHTVNGWARELRTILKAAKRTDLVVKRFDTSEHETYTEEEPNALLPIEVAGYLARFREVYPQHYAMLYLGMVTGLRPSSLRPLRRSGDNPDVEWGTGRLRVRRSHTLGDEVMNTTKQKRRYNIALPPEAIEVLRWHVATQLRTPEQLASDLLFPAVTGGFRAPSVLNKPMGEVAEALELGKRFTQKGLRRTFNDLARAAKVEDVVTRSVSGHLTEEMQAHYSTVARDEQREALGRVVALFERRAG